MKFQEAIVLNSTKDLAELLSKHYIWPSFPCTRIVLNFSEMSAIEKDLWESRLTHHFNDCGCKIGAIVLLTAIGLYLLYIIMGLNDPFSLLWKLLIHGLMVFLVGLITGKIIGATIVRYRLKRTIDDLQKIIGDRNRSFTNSST